MNIKQLNYFIAVAKYLNFTKAANHHHIPQTVISHQITALEKEIGVPLFYRNTRTVQLTKAGELFFNEVKPIIANLEQAINRTILTNSNAKGSLTIGFTGAPEKFFLSTWIRNFLAIYPKINLKLIKNTTTTHSEFLQEENIDILFELSHDLNINPKLSWKNVYSLLTNHLYAVTYPDHPLAKQTTISRLDLANEPFVFFDHKSNPAAFDLIVKDSKNTGFLPKVVAEANSAEALLLMVEAKIGITILPRCFEESAGTSVKFIALEGDPDYHDLIALWRKDNLNSFIPLFLNMIKVS
ncbi:MAG: hypothetical protein H6Q73_4309 [Firmicutes bacterium]|nr:hypothetical protein [Bacillota bacterium]